MTRTLMTLAVLTFLTGCAADQFHVGDNPTLSLREANTICAHEAYAARPTQSSRLGVGHPGGSSGR